MRRAAVAAMMVQGWTSTLYGAEGASPVPKTSPAAEVEVTVRAERPPEPTVTTRVSAREAASTPGAHGDAALVIQSLPGVARVGTSGDPVLWGSAPRETGIFLDDVPLPFLFHGSGIRAVVPTVWLSAIEVVPAAYGVELGRQLGGVVRLRSSEPSFTRPSLALSVDTVGSNAAVSAPLGKDVAVRVGGGVGYVEAWLPHLIPQASRGLYSIPNFWNAQAQALYEGRQDRVKVNFVAGGDHSERSVPSGGSWGADQADERRLMTRLYVVYEHDGPSERTTLTPYVGLDQERNAGKSRGDEVLSQVQSRVLGLRLGHVRSLSSRWTMRVGIDAQLEAFSARHHGSLTIPAREGDLGGFGTPPGRDSVQETAHGLIVGIGPYAAGQLKIAEFVLDAGMRLETFLIETKQAYPPQGDVPSPGSSSFYLGAAPYARASWDMSERARLSAAVAVHHQAPDPRDLGAFTGTPTLAPARAVHFVLSERVELTRFLTVDAAIFHKSYERLAARSTAPSPPRAHVLTNLGTGQSYGAQSTVRVRRWAGLDGWLTWTISRSERRDDPSQAARLFDEDQPWLLTLVLNKALGPWTVGGRLRFASGSPAPRVVAADYDTFDGRYDPVFSRAGGERLPPFFALDLRVERRFALSATSQLSAYAELLNATNHKNADDVAYSWDYRERQYLTGLPTVAMLGATLSL